MEMEDHSQHSHYTPIDLRHFISQKPSHFPSTIPPPPLPSQPDLFRNIHPSPDHAYHDMMMLIPRGGLQEFRADHSCNNNSGAPIVVTGDNSGGSNTVVPSAQTNTVLGGLDGDAAFGGDGGTGRWPRQETLTLLEIRSRLDSKFKEANQKGPLWDEVSRIMSEEHGYQRSGKKCREKFENLYKYYKKTKEGKAGRQDGKHYRFFRQLEALYGESSNANHTSLPETQYGVGISSTLRYHSTSNASGQVQEPTVHSQKLCDSLSLSNNSSEFDTSSYEDNDLSTATLQENNDSTDKRRKRRGGWKAKIKDFIDSQMKKLIERQEAWLDKLTKTLEQKEQERLVREEEWRKQEAARIDKEHKFWAKERAWIEARDSALMDALKKLSGRETVIDISSTEGLMGGGEINNPNESRNEHENETEMNGKKGCDGWEEIEITRLVQIRSSMESKFQQSGCIEEALWEDIEAKMACFGYKKSALMCKEKWERINNRVIMRKTNKEGNKKRKENSRESCYHVNFESNESAMYNNQGGYCDHLNGQSPPPNSSNAVANSVSESCFRYFICEGDSLWENYGLKLNSGDHNQ